MLGLVRRLNEVLIITVPGFEPIEIKICNIKGMQVKLGISAEKRIGIYRDELYRKLIQESGSFEKIHIQPGKSWREREDFEDEEVE